jgi:hypothetical protein
MKNLQAQFYSCSPVLEATAPYVLSFTERSVEDVAALGISSHPPVNKVTISKNSLF